MSSASAPAAAGPIRFRAKATFQLERRRLLIAQGTLAAQLRFSQNKISRIEMGRRVVTLDEAVAIARALGLTLDTLFEDAR